MKFLILYGVLLCSATWHFANAIIPLRSRDERSALDNSFSEFGSGTGPWIDDEQNPDAINARTGSDDEDYSYLEEQLQPSSPKIPDLPSPTFQLEPEASVNFPERMSTLIMVASDYTKSTNLLYSPTPSLPAASFRSMSSSLGSEWIHIGSGDSIDVDPTPSIGITSHLLSTPTLTTSNTPPVLAKPISKILVHGGHFLKQRIDSHFHDDNDLSLKYSIITNDDWIYVLGNDLIMFPSVEDVSEYRFDLTAEDSGGLIASTDVIVSVRQPSKSRQWYFYFEFSFPAFFNWRESIHHNMTQGSHNHGSFVVTKVSKDGNKITLQYVNETLMDFDACPMQKISTVVDHYKQSYPDFHYVMLPGKMCEGFRVLNTSIANNYPPSIKNQIDFINSTAGELFIFKVPDDFCYDPEEGSTANLHLELVDFNQEPLKPNNWLQFDTKNQEFYGIYVNNSYDNVGPGASRIVGGTSGGKYALTCSDSHGKKAVDVLDSWVAMPDEQFNAEFSLHFLSSSFGPLQIRKFVEKLGSLFNSNPNQIKIKSYSMDNNVVHFSWFNKSNPGEKEITQLRKVLFSNEGPVDKKVVELFSPDFNITGGNIVPIGRLIGEDTVFHFQTPSSDTGATATGTADREGDVDDEVSVYSNYSSYLVTYIIPSVLIAVMVLLSLIIACLLSRKKKVPGEGNEIRKAGGGVPVIFQDELEADHPLLQSASIASPAPPKLPGSSTGKSGRLPQQPPPPVHRSAASVTPPVKYSHPPGYKSVSKYEPPMPPLQFSGSTNKYHHNSNSGILPPPYVPP